MHRMFTLIPLLALACGTKATPQDASATVVAPTSDDAVSAGITAAIDRSVDPCEDFYQFACGTWLDTTELPSDRPVYGRGFSAIQDRNLEIERQILEHPVEGADPRVADFYQACSDVDAIEARGITSLQADLARIQGVKSAKALTVLLTDLVLADAFYGGFVEADFMNPDVNMLHLAQGGIGLPERGYYFPEDEEGKALLADYKAHVGRMLELAGMDAKGAAAVLTIETALAKASKAPAELREIDKLYHPTKVADLSRIAPGVDWKGTFAAFGIEVDTVNLLTPDFFPALSKLLTTAKLQDLKTYTSWRLISGASGHLTQALDDENFAFFGTRLSGAKEQQPRWKRCVNRTDGVLGDLLGEAFVAAAFPGQSKDIALGMVGDLQTAFEAGLADVPWMDDVTRERAKAKLHAITNKIGYPDTWETYEGLVIGEDHYANTVAVSAWGLKDSLKDIGKPVDKTEWGMSAPTVNAYYNPLVNEIVFPAGILQPPFFSASFPAAMNYGAMGMVIGHEITHGFDDEGRKFGPDGTMEVWWDDAATERFEEAAACITDTYAAIEVQPGAKLNGELTLGENIADFGGIKMAHSAYAQRVATQGAEQGVAGFTPEQLLFVAYAQSWCSLATPEVEKLRARTDPHAPPRYRVNVPLAHLPAFGEAFSCDVGSPMRVEDVCSVW